MAGASRQLLLALAVVAVVALPAMVAGARPVSGGGFTVEGGVFCDTCQAGFETPATTTIAGAKVRVECRDRETEVVKFVADGVSDGQGKYKIYVAGEHETEICESVLVSSPLQSCSTPLAGRERSRIVLSHHNGVVSDRRFANNLGFVRNSALAGCAQIMKAYQQLDD
ncbi:protein DOWNSTREAM OF FLC-like [Wolffia australiana]